MSLRWLLVVLVVVATAAFVVGVAIERDSRSDHHDTTAHSAPAGEATGERHNESREAGGAGEGVHDQARAGPSKTAETSGEELRPLGIDVEAWPFVALGAFASLALAAAAVLRPRSVPLLAGVGVALAAFAVVDVREVAHQLNEGKTGLAVLAGAVALLHLAAAAVAGVMASRARTDGETVRPAGTAPA